MRKVYYIYNPQTQTYDRIYPTVRQRMVSLLRRLFIGMGLGAGSFIILLIIFGSPSEKELRKENSQLLAQYNVLSRRLDEAVQRRSKFNEAMSVDNKWITLMKSVSTATQLSQELVDESVEKVKIHEDGAVELVMKYGDIYALTIQSIKEVQEAM